MAPAGSTNHNSAALAMSIPPMPLIYWLLIMMTLLDDGVIALTDRGVTGSLYLSPP